MMMILSTRFLAPTHDERFELQFPFITYNYYYYLKNSSLFQKHDDRIFAIWFNGGKLSLRSHYQRLGIPK